MGFGDSAVQIIFFVVIVIVVSSLIVIVSNQLDANQELARTHSNTLSHSLMTSISLVNIAYDPNSEQFVVYLKNTGLQDVDVNAINLYVNSQFISPAQQTIVFEDSDTFSQLLEPQDVVRIQTTLSNQTNTFFVQIELGTIFIQDRIVLDSFAFIPPPVVCPDNYVKVRGGFYFDDGTTVYDFCVSKYEMRCPSDSNGTACPLTDLPVSQFSQRPWVNINQVQASARCEALGEGYSLISDQQWMMTAERILQVPINDLNDTAPNVQLANGRSSEGVSQSAESGVDPNVSNCNFGFSLDASLNSNCGLRSSEGYVFTGGSWNMSYDTNTQSRAKLRVHVLPSGELIWDMAGNVYSLTSNVLVDVPDSQFIFSYYDDVSIDYTGIAWMKPSMLLGSSDGFGVLYVSESGQVPGPINIRGGNWEVDQTAGVFNSVVLYSPSTTLSSIGFRCVFTG